MGGVYHAVASEHDEDKGLEGQQALFVGAGGQRSAAAVCVTRQSRGRSPALIGEFVVEIGKEHVSQQILLVLEGVVPVPARAAAVNARSGRVSQVPVAAT